MEVVVHMGDEIGRQHFHVQFLGDVGYQNHIVESIETIEPTYLMGQKWT